jgi:TPR repeat protein
LAAEQGSAFAQFNLGRMYRTGQGVPQDYVQAHMWANLAAAQNHKNALVTRNLIAKKMSQSQIAEAQRLAREWKPKQ